MKLNGKVAVITGGSRGLGRATALRLAADGATVAVHYRADDEAAQSAVAQIREAGGRAVAVQGELGGTAGLDSFFANLDAALEAETGDTGFDILVVNAGVNVAATIADTTEAQFDTVFDLNVKGVFFLVQKALGRLRDGGRVITLSSGLSRFAYPQYIAYSASKGAIDVFTRVLAKELGPRGITVNAVAPGAIDTDMNKDFLANPGMREMLASIAALGRVGMPDDIGDVMSFLAGEDSRWVTGQRIEASGGAHL